MSGQRVAKKAHPVVGRDDNGLVNEWERESVPRLRHQRYAELRGHTAFIMLLKELLHAVSI